jgi:hypothetical protein
MKLYNETPTGYRFNKLLIWGTLLILIGFVTYNYSKYGLDTQPYFKCNDAYCKNKIAEQLNPMEQDKAHCTGTCMPIKCEAAWCTMEYVPRGEYGERPSWVWQNFNFIAWGLVIVALVLNHFLFNRGVKFSLPTKRKLLPTPLAYIVKKIFPKFENEVNLQKDKNETLEELEE